MDSRQSKKKLAVEHQILLVDDNPGMIQLMGRILSGFGQQRFATSGAGRAEAWQLDIDDFDADAMAREILSPGRKARRRVVA